ncbi:MAG: hypothetical protein QM504_01700 [Pseudomonadota bacterium]
MATTNDDEGNYPPLVNGAMTTSTLLTLIVVPVACSLFLSGLN